MFLVISGGSKKGLLESYVLPEVALVLEVALQVLECVSGSFSQNSKKTSKKSSFPTRSTPSKISGVQKATDSNSELPGSPHSTSVDTCRRTTWRAFSLRCVAKKESVQPKFCDFEFGVFDGLPFAGVLLHLRALIFINHF